MKYNNSKILNESVVFYLRCLFFEKDGYDTLLKEFLIDSKDINLNLDENNFKLLLEKQAEANTKLFLAIEEILKIKNVKDFYIDYEKQEIFWND